MADQEQVDVLRQCAPAWNAWREAHPTICPHLSGANLSGAKLGEADLSGANLTGATLVGADLTRADLAGANLAGANLAGADLSGADLSGADLAFAGLAGAGLTGANLAGAGLTGANLAGANLAGANLAGANLAGANLVGAGLTGADLAGAGLTGADLSGADLSGADLSRADLSGADLGNFSAPSPRPAPGAAAAGVGHRLLDVPALMRSKVRNLPALMRSKVRSIFDASGATVAALRSADIPRAVARSMAPDAEAVDAAVLCPPRVVKGSEFLLQVFLYQPEAKAKVAVQAVEAGETAARRGTISLQLDLPRGAQVDLHVGMPGLVVAEPDATLVWRSRPVPAQFQVAVPADVTVGEVIGSVRFAVAGLPVGTLRFKVTLAASGTATTEPAVPLKAEAVRFRSAFASYSSEDQEEVLKRVQGARIAGLEVFQDALGLEPGQRWERELYRRIKDCDVFLLFWSRSAAASEWVAKEIAYALECQEGLDDNLPAIQPVPLEGPPPPPPPDVLRHLHFNDALLAHIHAATSHRS